MLSDDVAEQGFVLLCCGRPESDCAVRTVDEARRRTRVRAAALVILHTKSQSLTRAPRRAQEELLAVQMHSGAL